MFTKLTNGRGIAPLPYQTELGDSGALYWDNNNKKVTVINQNGVSTGSSYLTHASIQLDNDTQSVIDWARIKMVEEQQLTLLLEKYPGLKEAKELYDIQKALCK